jgi:hypothetical protein
LYSDPPAVLPHEIIAEPRTATGNKSILYCQIT